MCVMLSNKHHSLYPSHQKQKRKNTKRQTQMVVISFSIFQFTESFQEMCLHKNLIKIMCLLMANKPFHIQTSYSHILLEKFWCASLLIISPSHLVTKQLSVASNSFYFTYLLAKCVNIFFKIQISKCSLENRESVLPLYLVGSNTIIKQSTYDIEWERPAFESWFVYCCLTSGKYLTSLIFSFCSFKIEITVLNWVVVLIYYM